MQIEINDEGWLVTAPTFRFDIEIEADLIEEIATLSAASISALACSMI